MESYITSLPGVFLVLVLIVSIAVLGKGADFFVEQAVALSLRSGLPKVIIGATIVSLGTTLPEAAVSVLAAIQGSPGLAMGNAVGSVICDTGLILGIAALINPPRLNKQLVNRQGWLQIGAGFLLVLCCFPWSRPGTVFTEGGGLSQEMGMFFLMLLMAYLFLSVSWMKNGHEEEHHEPVDNSPLWWIVTKLTAAPVIVIISSHLLVLTATESARRLAIPDWVIASTLVAFGTSLPELVTAISAVRKNHGELAIGNVIGADILNILFVAGAAASVTPGGLEAGPKFFQSLFPGMLLILFIFRLGVFFSKTHLQRGFGFVLLLSYLGVSLWSYLV